MNVVPVVADRLQESSVRLRTAFTRIRSTARKEVARCEKRRQFPCRSQRSRSMMPLLRQLLILSRKEDPTTAASVFADRDTDTGHSGQGYGLMFSASDLNTKPRRRFSNSPVHAQGAGRSANGLNVRHAPNKFRRTAEIIGGACCCVPNRLPHRIWHPPSAPVTAALSRP